MDTYRGFGAGGYGGYSGGRPGDMDYLRMTALSSQYRMGRSLTTDDIGFGDRRGFSGDDYMRGGGYERDGYGLSGERRLPPMSGMNAPPAFTNALDNLLSTGRYGPPTGGRLYRPGGYDRTTGGYGTGRAFPPRNRPMGQGGPRQPPPKPGMGNASQGVKRAVEQKKPVVATKQTLEQHLKLTTEAIIGLSFIEERIRSDGDENTYSYSCSLCSNEGTAGQMASHVISAIHRQNYIKKHALETVDDRNLSKRCQAIETVHGRGSIKQKIIESTGFRKLDKSAFVKKVRKDGDVEMTDASSFAKKARDPNLREGDVVVEELIVSDDEDSISNPKLVVLQYFDELLSKDFSIGADTEASLIESIIRKLDNALFEFVQKNAPAVDEDEADNNGTEAVAAGEGQAAPGENVPPKTEQVADAPTTDAAVTA